MIAEGVEYNKNQAKICVDNLNNDFQELASYY